MTVQVSRQSKTQLNRLMNLVGLLISMFLLIEVISAGLLMGWNYKNAQSELAPLGYTDQELQTLYNLTDVDQLRAIQKASWQRQQSGQQLEFEAYSGHRESPIQGTYLNVNAAGFREIGDTLPWPPENSRSIFLFGGSTCFGYGVSDQQTIAYYLQQELNQLETDFKVYSFCNAYDYSSVERIRFMKLLEAGQRPAYAIFIDGLNDSIATIDPLKAGIQAQLNELSQQIWLNLFKSLHMIQLSHRLLNRFGYLLSTGMPVKQNGLKTLQRLQTNRKILAASCQLFGIKPIFVQQPVAAVGQQSLAPQRFKDPELIKNLNQQIKNHYQLIKQLIEPAEHQFNILDQDRIMLARQWQSLEIMWLAELNIEPKSAYVDSFHYSPAMNEAIAAKIVKRIRPQNAK